jgi:acetyl esterase/lipase
VPTGAVPARRTDLTGLPATWIGVAALDLFADEDVAYADRLRAAGVPVDVDLVEGALHGFQTWAAGTGIAEDYLTRARHWLGTTLAVLPRRTESET